MECDNGSTPRRSQPPRRSPPSSPQVPKPHRPKACAAIATAKWRPDDQVARGGIAIGKLRSRSGSTAGRQPARRFPPLVCIAANDGPIVRDGIPDRGRSGPCTPTPAPRLPQSGVVGVLHQQPGHSVAIDALSPACSQSWRNSSKRVPKMLAWTRQALPHKGVHGAMRIAIRLGSAAGEFVGHVCRVLPTEPRRHDGAVDRLRSGSHVPAISGIEVPCASRCSAIMAALASADSARGAQWPPPADGATRRDRTAAGSHMRQARIRDGETRSPRGESA